MENTLGWIVAENPQGYYIPLSCFPHLAVIVVLTRCHVKFHFLLSVPVTRCNFEHCKFCSCSIWSHSTLPREFFCTSLWKNSVSTEQLSMSTMHAYLMQNNRLLCRCFHIICLHSTLKCWFLWEHKIRAWKQWAYPIPGMPIIKCMLPHPARFLRSHPLPNYFHFLCRGQYNCQTHRTDLHPYLKYQYSTCSGACNANVQQRQDYSGCAIKRIDISTSGSGQHESGESKRRRESGH